MSVATTSLKSISQTDYKNTRFHKAHVLKHPEVFNQEVEKLKERAFDKAKEEQTKKSIQKAQKENMNRLNEQRANERGKQAAIQENAKRDKALFEAEMKKLLVQEGMNKIKQGGGTQPSSVVQERKEKQKKEKMLKMFEEEVITQ